MNTSRLYRTGVPGYANSFLIEAIDTKKKREKLINSTDKTVVVAGDIKKEFKAAGLLGYFENLAYSHRKEYVR